MPYVISQTPFSSPSFFGEGANSLAALLEQVDFLRWEASRKMSADKKIELGQFLTPMPVAQLMASMVRGSTPTTHILDPGAGVGTLFTACVAELCQRPSHPQVITVTASEKLSKTKFKKLLLHLGNSGWYALIRS
jgi:hypothetical protein